LRLKRCLRCRRREYLVKWSGVTGPLSWETRHIIRNPATVNRFDKQWDAEEKQREQELLERKRREMSRKEVIEAQKEDLECKELIEALEGKNVSQSVKNDADQCLIVEGALYHKDIRRRSIDGQLQLVIPKMFRKEIIEEIHGGVLGGHFAVQRTWDAVRRFYWWHGMKKDVGEVVKACPECNSHNKVKEREKPFLQAEERTAIPWERVGIDYTEMGKSKSGYSQILVLIDHATKYVIAKPTKDGSAETAANILFEEVICKYGAPKELWSDRGKSFIGEVAKYLTDLFKIDQKFTSGYHPQTNGLTERFNKTIADMLAKSLKTKKDEWPIWLQAKVFAYNTTAQKSTQYSPFELLHTFTPRTPVDIELVEPSNTFRKKDWADEIYKIAREMREDALKNQQAAAKSQEKQYNKHLKPTSIKVGDYVRLFDPTAEAKEPVKLRNQYIGPFRVRGRKGMLFELEDLKGARLKGRYNPKRLKVVNEEGEDIILENEKESIDAAEATSTGGEV